MVRYFWWEDGKLREITNHGEIFELLFDAQIIYSRVNGQWAKETLKKDFLVSDDNLIMEALMEKNNG